MPKFGFLVVEGPHDAEFAYRLLSPCGLKRVTNESGVPGFLQPLIPREYPPNGDLQKRMSTPLFLSSESHALAIYRAEGDARLVEAVQENLAVLDVDQLTGMGIMLDADLDKSVTSEARYKALQAKMADLGHPLPSRPGDVEVGPPHKGAFVLPDNAASGTLEDLLLECAAQQYPVLLESARTHIIAATEDKSLTAEDLKDFQKPSGQNKAVVGSIAAILRPGKAIQVSIQDNRWLRGAALTLPRIKAVQDFLKSLFELS